MGLQITNTVSALAVFVQGILSFFSPCVLPLVPVYLSYLAGDAGTENQPPRRRRLRLLISTLFFVAGISFAIFTLGMGVSALGQFFSQSRQVFTVIGGLVLIVLGLVQLGLFGRHGFSRELRLPFRIKGTVNPFTALLLGFTFSFAWTPCVGPALASVLVMAGSASSAGLGFAYIGLYTLGFVLPFLALGLFADALLGLLRRSQKALAWTGRIGAVLLIAMGVLLLAGWVTSDTFRSDFLGQTTSSSSASASAAPSSSAAVSSSEAPDEADSSQSQSQSSSQSAASSSERPAVAAPDFILTDQYGNTHTLSDYKGKTVFLNFWADWCGYCVQEMPDVEQLYQDMGQNAGDVVVLSVTYGLTQDAMADFFEERNLTYPTLLDTDQTVFAAYGAYSLPTTFFIDAEGNVFGYYPGMMDLDTMKDFLQQTIDSVSSAEN